MIPWDALAASLADVFPVPAAGAPNLGGREHWPDGGEKGTGGEKGGFFELLRLANERLQMRLLTACLMPNHFHLVVWPHDDGDLSRWMQWLLTAHVRRYHRQRGRGSSGHVWQAGWHCQFTDP